MAKNLETTPSPTGVLLVNLGTPDGHDFWSVRRYLAEFLSDPRVIEMPRWQWWPILNLIILNVRPRKSGALYRKIWDDEANGSPLRVISERQANKLSQRLSGKNLVVDFAMRYGNPSIKSKMRSLKRAGCERVLVVPLYPQYSSPTTGSANQKAFDVLSDMRWQPAIRTVAPYYDNSLYITALATSIKEALDKLDFVPDRLVVSFHGMPQKYVDKGDPYAAQCALTTNLLRTELGWGREKIIVGFQSRFGREEWLKPYLDDVLGDLPAQNVKKVAIISPGFSVDCLETLEELAMEGKEQFLAAGGEDFAYIPCLNDTELGMKLIESLVKKNLVNF